MNNRPIIDTVDETIFMQISRAHGKSSSVSRTGSGRNSGTFPLGICVPCYTQHTNI